MNKVINLFDSQICVQCKKPCHFGSGRFVNRYPYDDGDVEDVDDYDGGVGDDDVDDDDDLDDDDDR